MMTQLQMLQMFWNDWGNHDLNFYKVYVQYGAITKDDYKTITGEAYVAPTTQSPVTISHSAS
ncbi:MAG: XkdX family protein [Lactobacillus sp.]|nr:MAG: XkdX family protein [Lactobacillus sp.]